MAGQDGKGIAPAATVVSVRWRVPGQSRFNVTSFRLGKSRTLKSKDLVAALVGDDAPIPSFPVLRYRFSTDREEGYRLLRADQQWVFNSSREELEIELQRDDSANTTAVESGPPLTDDGTSRINSADPPSKRWTVTAMEKLRFKKHQSERVVAAETTAVGLRLIPCTRAAANALADHKPKFGDFVLSSLKPGDVFDLRQHVNIFPALTTQTEFRVKLSNPSQSYADSDTIFSLEWPAQDEKELLLLPKGGNSLVARQTMDWFRYQTGSPYAPVDAAALRDFTSGGRRAAYPDSALIQLGECLAPLACAKTEHGVPFWRKQRCTGILLCGPPGGGKSTLVRDVAERLEMEVLFLNSASTLNRSYVGQSERYLHSLGAKARANPHLLFIIGIDEIHTLIRPQSQSADAHGSKQDLLTVIYGLMDDQTLNNIVWFAMTNYPELLPEPLRRSGRFSSQIYVGALTARKRALLLGNLLPPGAVPPEVQILSRTTNWTLGQIAELSRRITVHQSLAGGVVNVETVCDEVAERSEMTRGYIARLGQCPDLRFPYQPWQTALLQKQQPPPNAIRRVDCFAESRTLHVYSDPRTFTTINLPHATLPDAAVMETVKTVMALVGDDTIIEWLDGQFREQCGDTTPGAYVMALRRKLDDARKSRTKTIVVVEVDQSVGAVPVSHSNSHSQQSGNSSSTSLQSSTSTGKTTTDSKTRTESVTLSQSRADSHTTGATNSFGTSISASHTTGVAVSDGTSTSRGTSASVSGGVSSEKGWSLGVSASKSVTHGVSHSVTHSTSTTQSHTASTQHSASVSDGVSISRGVSSTRGISTGESVAKTSTDTTSSSSQTGTSDATGLTSAVTTNCLYPHALNALRSLVAELDGKSLIVVLVYRTTTFYKV
jgi:hypothetical protein